LCKYSWAYVAAARHSVSGFDDAGNAVMATAEMLAWGLIYIVGIFTAPYMVGALICVFTLPVVIIVDLLDQLTDGTPPVETKPTLDA
jgi:hypothetical protein